MIIISIYLIVIYVCVGVFMFLSLEGGGWWKFVPWHTLFAGFFFPFIFPLRLGQSMVVITVSQVEHGVLQLVDNENPQITVLVDCEGLSPLRVPMQILRSCSCLLQDHFPKRLGCLFVIKLPPVARVIAQTFIQVSFKFT